MATATWTHSYGGFRITYSTSVASNNTITVNITKVEVSSTYYTGYIYPDCKIQINGTTVITMDCDTVATHRAYCSSTGTYYTVVNYNGNSNGSAATGSKSGIAVGTAITISCVGNSYSSGNSVYIYHDSYRWTISGTTTTVSAPTVYTVSYNANGGSSTPAAQKKVSGQSITVSSAISRNNSTANGYTVTFNGNGGTPSKASATATNTIKYTFTKWNTAANGSGTSYNAGATYSANANATLYAQWSSSVSARGAITTATASRGNGTATRTVTFNANGGSCSTASLNSTATITYSCNGWYTAASGGTKRAASGGSYTPSASETVYAQWGSSTGSFSAVKLPAATKANGSATRTITFNGNGGSTPNAMTSTATITYAQTGWFTASSGGTNRGNAGVSYTPSAAETLYAQFSSSTGAYSAITLPTPTRDGYNFLGWATSADATSGNTGSYTPSGNVTLYAIWGVSSRTITVKHYMANTDGSYTLFNTETIETSDSTFTPTTVEPREGNTAVGATYKYWNPDNYLDMGYGSGIPNVDSFAITDNHIVHIDYPLETYNISISADAGSRILVMGGSTTIQNGDTITYGDKLKIHFIARPGYSIAEALVNETPWVSGDEYTVSGDTAITSTATAAAKVSFVYISNNPNEVYIKHNKRYVKFFSYVYTDGSWKASQ